MKHWIRVCTALLTVMWFAALAQDAGGPTVTAMQSDEYGAYLADADGRTLYLFVNEEMMSEQPERMTEGVRANAAPCSGGCLDAWPPLTGEAVQAGEGVDAELLYLADVDGTMQVVYNGWPLYYFARDEEPGQTNGQGVGGAPNIWYLVSPDGAIVGASAEAGDGEAGSAEDASGDAGDTEETDDAGGEGEDSGN